MRDVYVQRNLNNTAFLSENCFIAASGFGQMGYKVIGFVNPRELPLNKYSIVVGGINSVREHFSRLEINQPEIDNPHTCLPKYIGRTICEMSFSDVEEYAILGEPGTFPFFIKPLIDHKLFTGYVVNSKSDLIQAKLRTKPESMILVSDCIKIVSEYRCFVLNGKLVGCKNYTGDFTVYPDFQIIEYAISDYNNSPAAYSIDFGITRDGRTLLIEMNDGFGLSSYGLNKLTYCKMLEARWDEIMKIY
jgi:hypothetical protein